VKDIRLRYYTSLNYSIEDNQMRHFIARTLFVPTLLWNMLLGRVLRIRNWWDQIEEHVFIGALPLARDVPKMKEAGIKAVVNTCEEYPGPVAQYEAAGIEQLRIPSVDFTSPSMENVIQGVEFIEKNVRQGKSVYVHCKAGRARSAMIVLCWLISSKGMTPEQGQKLLLEKRPHVHKRLAERRVVRDFYSQFSDSADR
jgi:atypical dual specificity phosphatase